MTLAETYQEMAAVILSDPSMSSPDTVQKVGDLQQKGEEIYQRMQDADAEASRIADEHQDEIKTP